MRSAGLCAGLRDRTQRFDEILALTLFQGGEQLLVCENHALLASPQELSTSSSQFRNIDAAIPSMPPPLDISAPLQAQENIGHGGTINSRARTEFGLIGLGKSSKRFQHGELARCQVICPLSRHEQSIRTLSGAVKKMQSGGGASRSRCRHVLLVR